MKDLESLTLSILNTSLPVTLSHPPTRLTAHLIRLLSNLGAKTASINPEAILRDQGAHFVSLLRSTRPCSREILQTGSSRGLSRLASLWQLQHEHGGARTASSSLDPLIIDLCGVLEEKVLARVREEEEGAATALALAPQLRDNAAWVALLQPLIKIAFFVLAKGETKAMSVVASLLCRLLTHENSQVRFLHTLHYCFSDSKE